MTESQPAVPPSRLDTKTYILTDQKCIKIGRTTDIVRRLAELQTGSSVGLEVLLILNGDHERELHRTFKRHHVRGEWYEFSEEIRLFVAWKKGQPWWQPFHRWLLEQRDSQDGEIARLARVVAADASFPDSRWTRLHTILNHYPEPRLQKVLRRATRIWRRERRRFIPAPRRPPLQWTALASAEVGADALAVGEEPCTA